MSMILGALAFTAGAVKHLYESRQFQESPSQRTKGCRTDLVRFENV
jgi:hypothetical protein